MKKICLLLLSIFTLFSVSPVISQSTQVEIDQANRNLQQWTKSLAVFVKDVRFNEKDVQDMINKWSSLNAIGGKNDDDEEYLDFNSILNDPAYLSWAKSKGINSEIWLKKSMRIMAMMMRTSIKEGMSEGNYDKKIQLADIETMRAQVGEEMYQQMKQAMEAGIAAMQGVKNSYKHLPTPTESEKVLLEKYMNQLMNLE